MGDEAGGERGVASVGGLHIAYASAGRGDPTVLFIHGAFADRAYFAPQVAHLAPRRRVVTPDLRGHGASHTPTGVSIADFAADVLAVADAAGVERAVLCGHSMGGVVALAVAAARPALVRGIAMLDGTVLFPEPARRQGLETLVPALGTERWLDALRGYFGRTLDPDDPPALAARMMADLGRTRPAFARTFFTSLFASDYAAALREVRCPLLYIHAKAPADLARLQALRPDALVGRVVGSGHYLMLAVPEQVNAMLDRFLEVVDRAALPA